MKQRVKEFFLSCLGTTLIILCLVSILGIVGFGAGTKITTVRKTADETVNNSTTLQNDDALLLAIAANETWFFTLSFGHVGDTTADLKFSFTIPSGASIRWGGNGAIPNLASGADPSASVTASGTTIAISANTSELHYVLSGVVVNSTTAGDLQFQWAQNVATVANTKILANSYLEAYK